MQRCFSVRVQGPSLPRGCRCTIIMQGNNQWHYSLGFSIVVHTELLCQPKPDKCWSWTSGFRLWQAEPGVSKSSGACFHIATVLSEEACSKSSWTVGLKVTLSLSLALTNLSSRPLDPRPMINELSTSTLNSHALCSVQSRENQGSHLIKGLKQLPILFRWFQIISIVWSIPENMF